MKAIAIIINFFFPGVGTMIVGKIGTGVVQLLLAIIGYFLTVTGVLSIFGIPMIIAAVIWSMVSAAKSDTADTIVVKQEVVREVIREVPAEKKREEE